MLVCSVLHYQTPILTVSHP